MHTTGFNPLMELIPKATIKTKMEIIHLVEAVIGASTTKSNLRLVTSLSSCTKNLYLLLKSHKNMTITRKKNSLIFQMNIHELKTPFLLVMMFKRKRRKYSQVL
jgi:hypothetical protein